MVRRALQQPYGGADGLQAQAVCATLATDPGLQPLLPYLVPMLADEVGRRLVHAGHLQLMLSATHALLRNPHLRLVPYIHHVLPAVLSCLLARNIGGVAADHWVVRDQAAEVLRHIARQSQQHSDEFSMALARVQSTLMGSLFEKAPETQYGSLVGLMAFGVPVLLHAVVPSVKRYSHLFHGTNGCSHANLELRAALMTVLGRCMAWQHGAYADVVWRAVSDAGLVQAVGAIAPAPEVHL
ncbi:hypothetical protein D9Q98_002594 [Chlorella vulgaris]|uniref:TAF6 C-terminal HEAT repeat domain-containing protein n=1 Tax=Chlorella vulgaris TaxID=3077 RepID=A0A9D4TTU5_CHLVU|nr:hypothetical protein D9Q98_002594 [Chlorella vulgaris]